MKKDELRKVLVLAQQLAKAEGMTKEDALDEAYRRTGRGTK